CAVPSPEAQALYDEARRMDAAGDFSDAAIKAERALSLWESAPEKPAAQIARCLTFLGDLYRRHRGYARAESFLERALSTGVAALGSTHPDVAVTVTSLGDVFYDRGDYDRAEPCYSRGLAIRQEVFRRARFNDPGSSGGVLGIADSLSRLGLLHVARRE